MADEVERGLESEQVTKRRKAKEDLKELLRRDRRRGAGAAVGRDEWGRLLRAYLAFETREMDVARRKQLGAPLDNALCARTLLRHALAIAHPSARRTGAVLQHSLDICGDASVDGRYRAEHRGVLVDVCESARLVQGLGVEPLLAVSAYLTHEFATDPLQFYSGSALRLMCALSRALFACRGLQVAEELCALFPALLLHTVSDPAGMSSAVAAVAACYSAFIDLFGVDCLDALFASAKSTLGWLIRHLLTAGARDQQRDVVARFLLQYLRLSAQSHFSRGAALNPSDSLADHAEALAVGLSEEAYLRSLAGLAHLQRDDSMLADPRMRLNCELVVECNWAHSIGVAAERGLEEEEPRSKRGRPSCDASVDFIYTRLSKVNLSERGPVQASGRTQQSAYLEVLLSLLEVAHGLCLGRASASLFALGVMHESADVLNVVGAVLESAATADDAHVVAACCGALLAMTATSAGHRGGDQMRCWDALTHTLLRLTETSKSPAQTKDCLRLLVAILSLSLASEAVAARAAESLAACADPATAPPEVLRLVALLVRGKAVDAMNRLATGALSDRSCFHAHRGAAGAQRGALFAFAWLEGLLGSPLSCRAVLLDLCAYSASIQTLFAALFNKPLTHAQAAVQGVEEGEGVAVDAAWGGLPDVAAMFTARCPELAIAQPAAPSAPATTSSDHGDVVFVMALVDSLDAVPEDSEDDARLLVTALLCLILSAIPERSFMRFSSQDIQSRFWELARRLIRSVKATLKQLVPEVLEVVSVAVVNFNNLISGAGGSGAEGVASEFLSLLELIRDSLLSSSSTDKDFSAKGRRNSSSDSADYIDDFLDESKTEGHAMSASREHRSEKRFRYAPESTRVLGAVALCYLSCKGSADEAAQRLGSAFTTHGRAKLDVPCEALLDIADYLARRTHSTAVIKLAACLPWDSELGMLGYYRVLCVLHSSLRVLRSKNLRWTSDEEDVVLKIVFPEDESIAGFSARWWCIPFVQLKCAALLMETSPLLLKEALATPLLSYLANADYRTRLAAAACAPLLFKLFPKHAKIYGSIKDQVFADSEDQYRLVSDAIAIAFLASASSAIVETALIDLIAQCVTRLARVSQHGVASTRLELLDVLVGHIARAHGYSSPTHLTAEYSRPILFSFITDEADRSIADFPFSVFGCASLACFVEERLSTLLAIASQLKDRPRLKFTQQLSNILKFGAQESGIAAMVLSAAIQLKAVEFYAFHNGVASVRSKVSSNSAFCENLQRFLSRNMDQQLLHKTVRGSISDLVKELFLLLCFVPHDPQHCVGAQGALSAVEVLESALLAIAETVQLASVQELLAVVNVFECIAALRIRFLEARTTYVRSSIFAAFAVISRHFSDHCLRNTLRCLLMSLVTTLGECSSLFPNVLLCLDCVANRLLAKVTSSKSTKQTTASILRIVQEFYCELVRISFFLASRLQNSVDANLAYVYRSLGNTSVSPEALTLDLASLSRTIKAITDAVVKTDASVGFSYYVPARLRACIESADATFRSAFTATSSTQPPLPEVLLHMHTILEQRCCGEDSSNALVWMSMIAAEEMLTSCPAQLRFPGSETLFPRCISSILLYIQEKSCVSGMEEDVGLSIVRMLGLVDLTTNVLSYRPLDSAINIDINASRGDVMHRLLTSSLSSNLVLANEAMSALRFFRYADIMEELSKKTKSESFSEVLSCFANRVSLSSSFIVSSLSKCVEITRSVWSSSSSIWIKKGKSYKDWICSVTNGIVVESYSHFLIDFAGARKNQLQSLCCDTRIRGGSSYFAGLAGVAALSQEVAEMVFILSICDIIRFNGIDSDGAVTVSKVVIRNFMDESCEMVEAARLGCKLLVYLLRQDFDIERQRRPGASLLSNGYCLEIDLLYASRIALQSGCACTSLLLYELWLERATSATDDSSKAKELFRIYMALNDPDELRGIAKYSDIEREPVISSQNGHWVEAMMGYECVLQLGRWDKGLSSPQQGLMHALESLGAEVLLRSASAAGEGAAARLSQWSVGGEAETEISVALRFLLNGDPSAAELKAKQSMQTIIPKLCSSLYDESSKSLVSNLSAFLELSELVQVCRISTSDPAESSLAKDLIERWSLKKHDQKSVRHRFSMIDAMLSSERIQSFDALALLEDVCASISTKIDAYAISPLFYKFKETILSRYCHGSAEQRDLVESRWHLSESRLLSKKQLLANAINTIDSRVLEKLSAISRSSREWTHAGDLISEAYRMEGEWAASTRRVSEKDLVQSYLEPAVAFATSAAQKLRAHHTLGDFNAKLHSSFAIRAETREWKDWEKVAADRVKEHRSCAELLRQLRATTEAKLIAENRTANPAEDDEIRKLNTHVRVQERECAMDKAEKDHMDRSLQQLLVNALENYSRVLQLSDGPTLEVVFQTVNLWLGNMDKPFISSVVKSIACSCPSYKLVPLHYQILSRLGTTGKDSQDIITSLIVRICVEHPYHTLPQLLAIVNEPRPTGAVATPSSSRAQAAQRILNKVQRNESAANLMDSTAKMLQAYIELALTSTKTQQSEGKLTNIRYRDLQSGSKRFRECLEGAKILPAMITLPVELDPTCAYSNVVRTLSFVKTFDITDTGVSRPKIIQCEGSDGVTYKQLVKGGDDLRQDAVMQQVFQNVNFTMRKDAETRKRDLSIRTYKITPLTSQAGVIEWVNNTIPFGTFLTDRGSSVGAHSRYYPADWKHEECRERLRVARENVELKEAFMQICSNMHPVFRYFFIEQYSDPVQWLTSRTAYTRSVAVTSMVGYVLGIGDRHSHNILVDTTTAEVIHIDFGIVFEQGKVLPTPETVPFRLTRDMVDGMGVTGVEGTFKKCCEESLRVLRLNTPLLLTILEVVIHDPFYKWRLSPKQVRQRQNISEFNVGKTDDQPEATRVDTDAARRTIIRIKNKLQGYDESAGEGLSVEGQVEILINEAKSVDKLCRLFVGWAPWL